MARILDTGQFTSQGADSKGGAIRGAPVPWLQALFFTEIYDSGLGFEPAVIRVFGPGLFRFLNPCSKTGSGSPT